MKPVSHRPGSGTVPKTLHLPWLALAVLATAVTLAAGAAHADAPFVDNGDGTVTDTSTELMWDQCSAGLSEDGCATGIDTTYTWASALGLAATQNAVNYKGYSDWRLPSVVELNTLVKTDVGSPTIDTAVFPNTPASVFWSASTYAPDPVYARCLFFNSGSTGYDYKTNGNYVRLVRSGQ